MREAQFLKQNADKWNKYRDELDEDVSTDIIASRFIELTDDLAYAKTFYPESNIVKFLNGLAKPECLVYICSVIICSIIRSYGQSPS